MIAVHGQVSGGFWWVDSAERHVTPLTTGGANMSLKRTIAAAAGIAALGVQPLSTLAQSPAVSTAGRPAADSIEEVVVTARRREENLQLVPISVTAISGEQLARQGIISTWDLANHIPS